MAIPIFTTLFINNLFPKEVPKWLVRFISVFAMICISLVLLYNDGDPIPADKLDAVFEKYMQIPDLTENQYHSSGIGLAFYKLAINAHGGRIAAISGEEYGVTFWFTLPVSNLKAG